MIEPPEKAKKLDHPTVERQATPPAKIQRPPWWALTGVGLLVVATVSGWLYVAFLRNSPAPSPLPTSPNPSQITRLPQSPNISGPANTSSSVAVVTPPIAATPLAFGVVISRALNGRDAPTTAGVVTKPLKRGDILELTRRNGGWYQTTEGYWISALFIEVRLTRAEAESYARELKNEG